MMPMTDLASGTAPRGQFNGRLRSLFAADRSALASLIDGTGNFTDEEVDVALELIDHGIYRTDPDYRFVVAEDLDRKVVGYACYGRVPLTEGTYDLYWIAVDKALQGTGVGRAIMKAVEADVKKVSGRMILIETASKPSYDATRAFYEKIGYTVFARIADFYRVGDDRMTYGRLI